MPLRIRLTWYDPPPRLAAGTSLALVARLKPPRGLRNPGGFDYERWLLTAGYGATGYVRSARIEEGAPSFRRSWLLLRARLADRYAAAAPDASAAALLTALAIGERFRFTEETWAGFSRHRNHASRRRVGHARRAARARGVRVPSLALRASAALGSQHTISRSRRPRARSPPWVMRALTGFALPAQRSLTMIVVALAIVVSRREIAPLQSLGAALLAILVLDPFAPLSASFWLSFAAVAFLMLLAAPRIPCGPCSVAARCTLRASRASQWAISLALLPLTALFFAEISVIGPAVNLLAIPLFNLVLVPLALLATLLTPLATAGDALIFGARVPRKHNHARASSPRDVPVGFAAACTAGILGRCSRLQRALFAIAAPPLPARRLAWLALLPLCWPSVSPVPRGAVRVVMLDVGHGLAVLIETREHRLLFDAGPRFPLRIRQRRADRASGTRR